MIDKMRYSAKDEDESVRVGKTRTNQLDLEGRGKMKTKYSNQMERIRAGNKTKSNPLGLGERKRMV